MSKSKQLQDQIVAEIIDVIQSGEIPFRSPFRTGPGAGFPLRHNSERYSGVNTFILWHVAIKMGYVSPYWMTFNQAKKMGASVRKGEKSTPVFYYGTMEIEDENSEDDPRMVRFLKSYRVFNASQIEGLPEKYYPVQITETVDISDRAKAAMDQLHATSAIIHQVNSRRAFYDPAADSISIAKPEHFIDGEKYATTLAHELVHWTGHSSREGREFGKKFGDSLYAFEELVAEMGAALLSAEFGLLPDHIEDHASYLQSWAKGLKDQPAALFKAAALAQKAANFIMADMAKQVKIAA